MQFMKKREKKKERAPSTREPAPLFLLEKSPKNRGKKNHKQAPRCLHANSPESHSNSFGGSTAVSPF